MKFHDLLKHQLERERKAREPDKVEPEAPKRRGRPPKKKDD